MNYLEQLKERTFEKVVLAARWSCMSGKDITFLKEDFTETFETKKEIGFVFGITDKETNCYEGLIYDKKDKTFRFMNFDNVKKNNFKRSITNYEDGHILVTDEGRTNSNTVYLIEFE